VSYRPLARSTDLVIEALGEELLIFDSVHQRAHSLNPAAAAVFRAADGTRTPHELATQAGLDEDATLLAIADLERCHLLAGHATGPAISRRVALRKAALAGAGIGVAIPVIRSITAPSAALAASACIATSRTGDGGCLAPADCCDQNAACVQGNCCFSQGQPCTTTDQCCNQSSYCNEGSSCQPD
jgi:hypothetical protein